MGKSWIDAFDPQRLRAARQQAGLTQRDLAIRLAQTAANRSQTAGDQTRDQWARAVELQRVRVVSYEQGTHTPRTPMLRRLAAALGVPVRDLLAADAPRTLATLRAQLGLTQAEVATHLSVGRAYYSRVEQGTAPLRDPADQATLATVLHVDPGELRRLLS